MIRFACGQCGKPLRAPIELAGKKGRCARCGAINPVPGALMRPIVLSVDVKRTRQSPFRSTADLEPVRGTIEGAMEVAGARFLADGASVASPADAREAFEPTLIEI